MSTYVPVDGNQPPMCFSPLASVCLGDAMHLRMIDYIAGQVVNLDEPNGRCAQDWLSREYADMLALARSRLIHDARSFRDGSEDEEEAQEPTGRQSNGPQAAEEATAPSPPVSCRTAAAAPW